jgi:hypothetical protein
MQGDAVTRFCDHCELHVQNLSAMSARKVARVLKQTESEPVCVTYTRRRDGSMVTRWQSMCDRVLLPMRRGFAWCLAAVVPVAFGACATPGPIAGRIGPRSHAQDKASEEARSIVVGGI